MTPDPGDASEGPGAASDLRELLQVGLARGGHLLTAGERFVVDAILALSPEPARLYALLTARTRTCWPLATVAPHSFPEPLAVVLELERAGLVDRAVPWPARARGATRAQLADACRSFGLPTSGRQPELAERLGDRRGWTGPWIRLRHRALVQRLEQWAMLRAHPDRSWFVVERLGHVRWPDYPLTPGPALFRDRRALLAWEALLGGPTPESAIASAEHGEHRAPGRLDLGGRLTEALVTHAQDLERAGALAQARELYQRASSALGAEVVVRVARTLELEGRPGEAFAHLLAARPSADDVARVAIDRMGRRLAGPLKRAWPPSRPWASPRQRTLQLEPDERRGARPRWRVDELSCTVEEAVIRRLSGAGRRALHAEGALWTTLFALLLAEAYFLPVPGALPVRFLSGPLDLGTPSFRPRRAAVLEHLLDEVRAGRAAERVLAADQRWRGTVLAGAHWAVADARELAAVAQGIGGPALAGILEVLLDSGWEAARGLPDLVVLPGPETTLPLAHPARLGAGLILAEVKGPGDSVRDAQLVWFDRLVRRGVPVELWEIRAAVGSNEGRTALER